MGAKLAIGLTAGVLLLGTYYLEDAWEKGVELPKEYTEGPEALVWLKKNRGESALASNRFGETQNATRFVRQLYDAGALRVVVPEASITKDDVETYSDSLVVTLPADSARRERVWRICAEEIRRAGFDPEESKNEKQVLLWWD